MNNLHCNLFSQMVESYKKKQNSIYSHYWKWFNKNWMTSYCEVMRCSDSSYWKWFNKNWTCKVLCSHIDYCNFLSKLHCLARKRKMATNGKTPAIGIDLGTTYSCVAVWQRDRVEIIANDQGNRTTPSYVAFNNTQRMIGDAAKNQAATNPTNTVFGKILNPLA